MNRDIVNQDAVNQGAATTGTRLAAPAPARSAAGSRLGPWAGVWGAVFVCSWGGNQFSPLLVMYEQRAHYSAEMVSALLGVYVLGLAPALLISGSLSDRHGRRRVMLAGVAAAVAGSTLLALGPLGVVFLALGRLLSGVTVGIAMAVGSSWLKELSQPPFDPAADEGSGARRGSLAFSVGAGLGALVAGLIAQWGPLPEVLPFLIHIAVTVPFAFVVLAVPETRDDAREPGRPWWRELSVPSVRQPRFTRVVAVAAPWLFASAGIGYGYLPTQMRSATGSWGLVFATATTVIALGTSSLVQPVAKRLHSGGLGTGVGLIAAGLAVTALAIGLQSPWTGLTANIVIGAGMGFTLQCGLLEVQRIAGRGAAPDSAPPGGAPPGSAPPGTRSDLAGLTGVFYALAYVGFLAPTVIAAVPASVAAATIVWFVAGLAVVSWAVLLVTGRTPTAQQRPAQQRPAQ